MSEESKEQTPLSNYARLAAINVNEHVEKKGKLSYLSWVWAVDQLFRQDPDAEWSYAEPVNFGNTLMVACTVTAFGKRRSMQLPVMNHANKAIENPDSFAVNTAMQRCLVKAIALHGLGLYIYAGEDLPPGGEANAPGDEEQATADQATLQSLRDESLKGWAALKRAWEALAEDQRDRLRAELASLKEAAVKADPAAKAKAALKPADAATHTNEGREPGSEG